MRLAGYLLLVAIATPSHASPELDRAAALIREGAVDEAVALARAAAAEHPDDARAHLVLGRALALVPEPSAALAALRRAVALRPEWAEAHHTLGTALARFGDLDGALAAFERAVALEPDLAESHASLGLLLAQRQAIPRAKQHLTRAIDLHEGAEASAYPRYLLAQILRQERALDEALAHLTAALAVRPDYKEAYLARGEISAARSDHASAREAFAAAVRLAPDDPAARAGLGSAYLRLDAATDAIPHLEHAIRLRPDDRTALYHLCRSYSLAARPVDARSCYERLSARMAATRGDSDIAAAAANREGLALEARGEIVAALERYEAAVELSPYATVLRRNLALAYCRLGRWHEGIDELKKVLDADPDDQDAIRALYIAQEHVGRTGP